jgi:hypothetical protein
MSTNKIVVKQLGLAAYIKMHGHHLMAIEDRCFVFDAPGTLEEWRLKYNNSSESRHDSLVCELRFHLRT